MDVDQEEPAQDSEDEEQGQRTPDADSTADETESDNEAPPSPPTRKAVNSKIGGKNIRADRYVKCPRSSGTLKSTPKLQNPP